MDGNLVQKENQGLGIAAVVCGTLSVVFFLLLINIPFAVAAICLGIMQLVHQGSKRLAVIGIALAVVSILLMFAGWAAVYSGLSQLDPGTLEEFQKQMMQQYL